MSYSLGYDISYKAERIIKELGKYRGMDAVQLTAVLHAPLGYTLADEKSTYNYLGKLKKQGLVSSHKLQASVSKGSLYYLTPKGYEYFKYLTNVEIGHYGQGWIETFEDSGYPSFGDLHYDLYKPPLGQPAHHLLLVDFFIQMKMIDGGSVIDHRLNLYAAHTYYIDDQKYRFRPDAEILFKDTGILFTVEIDRGTEDYSKLEEKFETYHRYFEYLKAQGKEEQLPNGILFVAESKRRLSGIKRRWASILKAFWSKLFEYRDTINLIYTTMDQVENTLQFEMDRHSLESKAQSKVHQVIKNRGYKDSTSYHDTKTRLATYAHGIGESSYAVYFDPTVAEFESLVYARFLDFINNRIRSAKAIDAVKGLTYKGFGRVIFHRGSKPVIFDSFEFFNLSEEDTKILNSMLDRAIFVALD